MERRKILLGSGAALATVLAGCSSTETDEETPTDDDGGFDDTGGSDDSSDDDGDGDDEHDDVPGVDNDRLEPDSDNFSIERITNSPETLRIVVSTQTTDTETLHKELKHYAEDIAHAITDRDRFKNEIEIVELILEYDGSRVLSVAVNVEWLMEFLDGEITKEQLGDKVVAAKE